MNIEKLQQMQEAIDNKIIEGKKLTWTKGERFINTVVAAITELAEFANEGRWFKVWSLNQKPNTFKHVECRTCYGTGDENWEMIQEEAEGNGGHIYKDCEECKGTGHERDSNPVLEEYVDGLHFFLSIGNLNEWQKEMRINNLSIENVSNTWVKEDMNRTFLTVINSLSSSSLPFQDYEDRLSHFKIAWFNFIILGVAGLGFTLEEIEAAYMEKNAINHERQANGY